MTIDVDDYYRRYGPMVLRRCRQLLRNEESAVDAMQDVFVQLIQFQARLTDTAPASLLNRMATNRCLNVLRTRKRKPEDPDDELLLRIAHSDDTEKGVLSRLRLNRIFGGEQESTRTMAVLHYVDGLTLEQTAEQVGLSVSGVRKRLRTLKARASMSEGA